MTKITQILTGTFLLAGVLYGKPLKHGDIIQIWPNGAPGSEKLTFVEEVIERSKAPDKIKDRAVIKVVNPTLTAYVPKNPNGTALLVTPGGAYARVVLDKEADELSSWLNGDGITYFVLRYRLPGDGHEKKEIVPLQDAQRALRLIRSNAKEWNLNPDKIGVLGFSAGGHVAASLSTKYKQEVYKKIDSIDEFSARPDFQILGYPVITMEDPFVHKGSRKALIGETSSLEIQKQFSPDSFVDSDTPMAFIMHATDDKSVPVENSLNYYLSLKKNGVPVEMHIYKDGGHGFSIRGTLGKSVANWTRDTSNWLKANDILD